MKKLEAIIKPFQLDDVKDALSAVDIGEIIVTDLRCSSNGEKDSESYLSDDYFVEFLPKIRVEIFVDDAQVQAIAEILRSAIDVDTASPSRIFVYDVAAV